MRFWLLRLHRWTTLTFALPLVVVLVTGLILSFEPAIVQHAQTPGALTIEALDAILARHDPAGQASGLAVRSFENRISLRLPGKSVEVDVATMAEAPREGGLSGLFGVSRGLHERLVFDMGWLVTASTIAMLVLAALGLMMGLPRLRNSLSGWHQAIAWFLLPLVVLSPLTGLAIAFGVTFAPPPERGGGRAAATPLREAVKLVAAKHDLSSLIWIRPRGGRLLARVNDGGEWRVYAVTPGGLQPTPRNWPRLIHEGNWAGYWSAGANVVTSFALLGLLGTGLTIWARRRFRRRPARTAAAPAAAA